jgi:hypothetical protein
MLMTLLRDYYCRSMTGLMMRFDDQEARSPVLLVIARVITRAQEKIPGGKAAMRAPRPGRKGLGASSMMSSDQGFSRAGR